jgi:hypothetical protein
LGLSGHPAFKIVVYDNIGYFKIAIQLLKLQCFNNCRSKFFIHRQFITGLIDPFVVGFPTTLGPLPA